MTKENFYLSLYQAIMDKNLTKALELNNLSDKENENYPEEYPELDYNEIFKDGDFSDFVASLLENEEYAEFMVTLINEVDLQNAATQKENHSALMNHPLVDYCPNPIYNPSVMDSVISISYSTIISKEEMSAKLGYLSAQSPIIKDVLSIVAISNTVASDNPFSIALIGEKIEEYDPEHENSTGGYYHSEHNQLVVTNKKSELNVGFTIHELSHKAMDLAFDNDSNPYNDKISKDKYHTALKNTLLNIQSFIKQNFGLDIVFENQNDTWQMGKTLSAMLFPQYLEGDSTLEFVKAFKQYNLNIDDNFSWLGVDSPLGFALSYQKFELASSLVDAGATVKPEILHTSSRGNNLEKLNWFLENKQNLDVNHKDPQRMTALDYAKDPEIISALISSGAIAYPPNYEPVCRADYIPQVKRISVTKTKQLEALEGFLNFYNQGYYDQSCEDAESIVRFPQIIAKGIYKGKIVDVFQDMERYWQEVISPAAQEYMDKHDPSDICLPVGEFQDLFA